MATDPERTKLAIQPMVSVYIYWALASTDVVEPSFCLLQSRANYSAHA